MYAGIAKGYNQLHQAEQQRKLRALLAYIDADEYESVIDVGCATAHSHTFFLDKTYIGVDPVQELLNQAPSHIDTICAPGEELPFADNKFDVAVSLTTLHNYDDYKQGVFELIRVSRKYVLVGVLKKAKQHDSICELLQQEADVIKKLHDQHDTLFVLAVSETHKSD